MTLLAPLGAAASTTVPYTAPAQTAAAVTVPAYGTSGIGAVGTSGLLAKGGTDKALPIASISKIITTLIVLEKHPIAAGTEGATLTFTQADIAVYNDYVANNGLVLPVYVGLKVSQLDVIELMLVASGNNYAHSLVDWAFGSEEAYAGTTRAWLDEHGMTSTSISDATGMNPKNVSTPGDLVTLGKLALKDPTIAKIIAMKTVTVPNVGTYTNTNSLLGVDGIDGIKTGTLDSAGSNLLFSSDITVGGTPITLVGVVLGAANHGVVDASVKALVESAKAGFRQVTLAKAGDSFGSYTTDWGEKAQAVAQKDATAVVWSTTPVTAKVATQQVTTAADGTSVGTVTFTVGAQTIAVPLILKGTLEDPGAWWRLTNPGDLF